MRILFVSPNLPYPPDDGGKIRIFNLIKYLSHLHEVTLICFVWKHTGEMDYIEEMNKYCKRLVPVVRDIRGLTRWKIKVNHLKNLFTKTPWVVEYLSSIEMREKIQELHEKYKFDIVQLEYGYMGQYIDVLKNSSVFLDEHNIEWKLWFQIGEKANSLWRRFYYTREGKKLYNWERNILKDINRCLVVSEYGKKILENLGCDIQTAVIPNGVDTEYFKPGAYLKEGMPGLLFLGSMNWFPNRDAVIYFCKDILPEVRKHYPDIKLYIVGKNTGENLKNLIKDNNIVVTGYVKDVRSCLQRNMILIVPLRMGEGTRFKILEALACGVPVVSTSLGCEGLDVEEAKNTLIADNPGEFANRILELLGNEDLREKLGKEGRRLVELNYDWENIVKKLNEVYINL